MKRLFAALGRQGFIIGVAVLALLYGAGYLLFVYMPLGDQAVPSAYPPVWLMVCGIGWYILAVIIQLKRLKDIGVNFWIGFPLALAAPLAVFFWLFWKEGLWQGLIPLGLWVAALAYKSQAAPPTEIPQDE